MLNTHDADMAENNAISTPCLGVSKAGQRLSGRVPYPVLTCGQRLLSESRPDEKEQPDLLGSGRSAFVPVKGKS